MAEQYRRSFTPAGGAEFVYGPPYYEWDRDGIAAEQMDHRIPQGETPADGEYQADSSLGPRVFSVKGTLIVTTAPSDLQARLDTLFAAHPKGAEGKLRRQIINGATIVSDRFLTCRVSSRTKGAETGLLSNKWEIGFRAANPFYEDWTAQAPLMLGHSAGGTATAITPGGTEATALIITLTVTGAGLITLTPAQPVGVESAALLSFQATAAGVYIVDNSAKLLIKDGANAIGQTTSGGFFAVPASTSNLTLADPAGVVSSASAVWRRRWSFA